jgi:hypothetical protein
MKIIIKNGLFIIVAIFFLSCNNKKSVSTLNETTDQNEKEEQIINLDTVISAQGYYIQQEERQYNYGHSPEILVLFVEKENVFIREIDIIDEKEIIRNKILLVFDEKTYIHNNTKLETHNGKIQIIYFENRTENYQTEIWDYKMPYTFAGKLNSSMQNNVKRLTTDHLLSFTGNYSCDSYEIIFQTKWYFDRRVYEYNDITINYDQEKKCLTFDNYGFRGPQRYNFNFVETTENEPFFWSYEESSLGSIECKLNFNNNDIVLTYNYIAYPGEEYEVIVKYLVFYKKN